MPEALGFVLALVPMLAGMLFGVARASPPSLQLRPCTVGKAHLRAHCGSLIVYENRSARSGRTIRLHVIEIDAVHRTNRAVFWNPGGPGADDSSVAPFIADGLFAKELAALRDRYDFVFVDNRGTGLSHLIQCDLYPANNPEQYYAQLFPSAPLRACRAVRSEDTDLSMYTTDIAADDLDDVRAALHYPKIVLDGGSYGTMFFLDYARRHPAHVESVVLQGVAPPGVLIIPLEDARGAQTAMDDLIADCARDAVCHAHFPALAAHFAALVRRFDAGPVRLHVREQRQHPQTAPPSTVSLSKEVFADRLRQTLYANESAAYVPYIVEQAYRENYQPLEQLIEVVTADFGRGLAMGLNLSVTCAEDIPFLGDAQIARSSAGTFEGDARVRAQQQACRIWNVRRASTGFDQPVRTNAPVLMISGAEDPATPPQYGRDALASLPNGRQIVIPNATHDSESDCTDALIVTFVRTGDAKHLAGAKCVGRARRPPFAMSMKGFGS